MRKTVLLCAITLVVGFVLGIVCNFSFTFSNRTRAGAVASTPVPITNLQAPLPTADQLDQSNNILLLQRAGAVLSALKAKDYTAFSLLIHPNKGITFTPYSTVMPETDLNFRREEIAALAQNSRPYVWGTTSGKGDPIELTIANYLAQYVYNADYTQAPIIGLDKIMEMGNAQENAADAYPDSRYVEYHFPGLDPKNEGFDWCSLKLVFEAYQNNWMLVGVIHSEWTP